MVNDPTPTRHTPGAALTAVVAVVYGLGVAFLPLAEPAKSWWLFGGAAVVGVLFLLFMVVPFVLRQRR